MPAYMCVRANVWWYVPRKSFSSVGKWKHMKTKYDCAKTFFFMSIYTVILSTACSHILIHDQIFKKKRRWKHRWYPSTGTSTTWQFIEIDKSDIHFGIPHQQQFHNYRWHFFSYFSFQLRIIFIFYFLAFDSQNV